MKGKTYVTFVDKVESFDQIVELRVVYRNRSAWVDSIRPRGGFQQIYHIRG